MQTVETKNEGLERAYRLHITAADIESRVDAEVKRIAPQVKMPGFRAGKVPVNLVKKMHKDALMSDALNAVIQEGVDKAIADNRLRPATQPHVHMDHDYAPGKDANIDFHFEILPDVQTPSIEGLKLERLTTEPTQEELDEALGRIASGNKRFETADKAKKAATGDVVVIDFEGKVDGVPFDGGKGEAMSIEIGSGQLIPGFEDQLVGLKANDEKVINVTFPEDYGAKELAGKAATFDIVVGEVKVAGETKIDDEFAKSLGLTDLEQLTGLVKGQLEQELNGLTRTYMKRQLLDQLAAAHDFAVPPSMVEAEFGQIWAQLEQEAAREEDPAKAKEEIESERDDYRRIAERRVRLGLLLSEIGQAHGVDVTPQEMNMLVNQAAQQYRPEDRQRFVEYLQQNPMAAAQIRAPLYEDKVVDFLFDKAETSDRVVDRAELEAAIEAEEGATPAAKPAAKKAPAKKAAKKDEAPAEAAADAAPAEEKPAKKPAAKKKADAAPAEEAEAAPAKKAPGKKAAAKADDAEAAPAKKPAAKKAAAKKD